MALTRDEPLARLPQLVLPLGEVGAVPFLGRDGSLLDERSMEILGALAKDKDYQVWMEVVDTTGTVGEAIAHLLKGRKWLKKLTLADCSLDRARSVADAVGAGYDVAQVDAGNAQQLKELIVASKADLVLNAVDPRFVPAIACTSSRISVSTVRSICRPCEVSSRKSDSGVVMRMSGGREARARRSAALSRTRWPQGIW